MGAAPSPFQAISISVVSGLQYYYDGALAVLRLCQLQQPLNFLLCCKPAEGDGGTWWLGGWVAGGDLPDQPGRKLCRTLGKFFAFWAAERACATLLFFTVAFLMHFI